MTEGPDVGRAMMHSPLQTPAQELPSKPCRLHHRQVEDGTPFGRWYPPGHAALPDDEEGAAMYRDASHMLREVRRYPDSCPIASLSALNWCYAFQCLREGVGMPRLKPGSE